MKRSKHSLSHYKLLTMKMGQMIPAGLIEVLPGDTIQHATSVLARCAPLNAPPMHPVHIRVNHWFVPTRLIWANFTKFITGGADGLDATTPPTMNMGGSGATVGSLADYLGVPTGVANLVVSALPFRAYALVYNEFYRDQDLITAQPMSTGDGVDSTTQNTLCNVAWEKDYYTVARPWTQKGSAITLPLGTKAWVKGIGKGNTNWGGTVSVTESDGSTPSYTNSQPTGTSGDQAFYVNKGSGTAPNIYADLSTATAATINQFRRALALQKYEEARAMYGSRYTEYLRYLGVRSSDARLQRPEYLGGGKQTLQFSEVLQSGVTTSGTPSVGVGSLLGHGVGAVRSNRYRRFFEEHGYVISILSILPKTMYVTGLPKLWSRQTKEDYWQKELERVGQQEVYNKEVYAAHSQPNGIFGWADRYDDYRRSESQVSGLFRTTYNYWHFGRIFASDPTLNQTFISANPSTRCFQDTTNDHLMVMASHSIQARRMVCKIGVPGGIL